VVARWNKHPPLQRLLLPQSTLRVADLFISTTPVIAFGNTSCFLALTLLYATAALLLGRAAVYAPLTERGKKPPLQKEPRQCEALTEVVKWQRESVDWGFV